MRRLDSDINSKQILLRIDRNIYNEICSIAKQEDTSITLKINELLEYALNNRKDIKENNYEIWRSIRVIKAGEES